MNNNYAKIDNGTVTEYPVTSETYAALKESDIDITVMDSDALLTAGFVRVAIPRLENFDGYDYQLANPILVDGIWTAQWVKDETTHEDIIAVRTANIANNVRQDRAVRIKEVEWRYQRYERNARLGIAQTDLLDELDAYVQALADVTDQEGFPFSINWPVLPS